MGVEDGGQAKRDGKERRTDGMSSSLAVLVAQQAACTPLGRQCALKQFQLERPDFTPDQFALIRAAAKSPNNAKITTGSHFISCRFFVRPVVGFYMYVGFSRISSGSAEASSHLPLYLTS